MLPIDVIIVNYHSTDYLVQCIRSLCRNLENCYRINILVEDNETNGSIDCVEKLFEINVIRNKKNIGFGAAINHALCRGTAPYIVFLNPDSILPDDSLIKALDYLKRNSRVGIVGPRIYEQDGSIQGSARRFPTPWTSLFGRKSPLTRLFPNNPISKQEFLCFKSDGLNEIDVDWVSGACMVIKREALNQVGGFDERFFLYWEDTDLCIRIKQAGYRVVYCPKANIIHLGGKSSSIKPIKSIFHFHFSCYKLFEKYSPMHLKPLVPFAFLGLSLRYLFVILLVIAGNAIKQKRGHKKMINKASAPKKRILRVITRLNIGGPSVHVELLSTKLNHEKFETKLVTGSTSSHEGNMSYLFKSDMNIYKIVELQREIKPINDIIAFLKILRIIAREKSHIVHTHTAKAGTIGRLAAICSNLLGQSKSKIVHTFHGHVLEGYFSPLESRFFNFIEKIMAHFSDAVIAISNSQQWELTQKFHISQSDKVHVINLGFDLSSFLNSSAYRGICRQRLGVAKETFLVGIIGRLVPIKNHKMFLESAKIFMERNPDIPVKFLIVGDGELKAELAAKAAVLGIQENVIFYGWEKNISKIYADLDVLALTSVNEGTPVSIIEAMASSVPVVTTGVGGIRDLLGNFESTAPDNAKEFKVCERGILCPKDDPVTFAKALEYILKYESSGNSGRICNARSYVSQNYSKEILIQNIEALYDGLLNTNKACLGS